MDELFAEEREIVWPEPREDPDEEPTEPWAKRDPDKRDWPWREDE